MSREDWEVFDIIKAERKEKRAERRETFNEEFAADDRWVKHNATHYSTTLNGVRLDYWPGPQRWRWKNRTYNGDVHGFIKNRENT